MTMMIYRYLHQNGEGRTLKEVFSTDLHTIVELCREERAEFEKNTGANIFYDHAEMSDPSKIVYSDYDNPFAGYEKAGMTWRVESIVVN